MIGVPAWPSPNPWCFRTDFPDAMGLSSVTLACPQSILGQQIVDKLGLVAQELRFGPHAAGVPLSTVLRDVQLPIDRRRLVDAAEKLHADGLTIEQAYIAVRDRELPNPASLLLLLPSEFPSDLWESTSDGPGAPRPARFVEHLLAKSVYAAPMDTFTGSSYELLRYLDGVYLDGAKSFIHAEVERAHKSVGRTARAGFAEESAKGVARRSMVERARLNPAGYLNLANGALDLNTAQLAPHSPALRFTYKLPTAFDPTVDCPCFLSFLTEVLPAELHRREIQKLFGYCFVPGNPYQVGHLFVGDGNNGKSTVIGILTDLLGPENVAAETLQALNENKFSSAKLYGKLLNAFADLPSNPLKQTSTFKTLTGGDQVRAELKFGAIFYFYNSAKLVFSANELPEVSERTKAFWRRWQLVPFDQDLTGRENRHLRDELRSESSGILNWALEGLRILRADGGFDPRLGGESVTAEWRRRSDTLAWFAAERVEEDPVGFVPKEDLYEAYSDFCGANRASTKSPEVVGKELPRHEPQARTEKRRLAPGELQVRGWRGIRLKRQDPASPGSPASAPASEAGEAGEAGSPQLRLDSESASSLGCAEPRTDPDRPRTRPGEP